MWELTVFAALIGCFVPVQTAANAQMRLVGKNLMAVTWTSFMVSFFLLGGITLFSSALPLPAFKTLVSVPWWEWTGGIIALGTISASILLFHKIGIVQSTCLILAGQLSFSLTIDHFGLFSSPIIEMNLERALALIVLFIGTMLAIARPKFRNRDIGEKVTFNKKVPLLYFWQLFAIAAGAFMACIGAIYGTLGRHLASALLASTLSFAIAVAALTPFIIFNAARRQAIGDIVRSKQSYWMWLGGPIGALSVYGNALLIPQIGAGVFFMVFYSDRFLSHCFWNQRGG